MELTAHVGRSRTDCAKAGRAVASTMATMAEKDFILMDGLFVWGCLKICVW